MVSGLTLLLLVCLHMRVQGKPRSQVGPATSPLGPGGTWERVGIPINANVLAVRGALQGALHSLSLFWTLCSDVVEVVDTCVSPRAVLCPNWTL